MGGTCTRTTGIRGHREVEVMARRNYEDESWLKVRARRDQDAEGHIEFQTVAGPRRGVYQIMFVRGKVSCPHVQFLCAGRHANSSAGGSNDLHSSISLRFSLSDSGTDHSPVGAPVSLCG